MRILLLDGNENQAVACVRSLARAGHRVEVGAMEGWSKAGWSRFADAHFAYPSPADAPDEFIAALARRTAPGTLILPLTERATLPISAQRDALLDAGARLVLPSHQNLLRAFDKQETTAVAREIGLETPQTALLESREDALAAAPNFPFPAVLKPRASQEIDPQTGLLRATGAPLYARDATEFVRAFDDLQRRCCAVIAQLWVGGQGGGYFALMNQGRLRAEFAHRRLRDVRPTGSGSALRESAAIEAAMRDGAVALLENLGWHGVAMVEFRVRPGGAPVFLEVNGRFWNSLALAIYAGVDFPALLAEIAERGDVAAPFPAYQSGVRCRWLLGDTRHLIEVWRGAPPAFPGQFPSRGAALRDFLTPHPGTRSDNFEAADPLPELGDWLDFVWHRLLRRGQKPRLSSVKPDAISSDFAKTSAAKSPFSASNPAKTGGAIRFPLLKVKALVSRLKSGTKSGQAAPKTDAPDPRLGALHLHSTYSDGEFSLPELRALLRAQGCTFAGVSDHADAFDDAKLAAYRAELDALSDAEFRFVPGLEYGCGRLHILGYGVTLPIASSEPDEVIAAIKNAGGVCVVAHPQARFFARLEALKNLPHGIEIWNSKYDGRYAPRPAAYALLRRLQARDASVRGFFGQDLHWKKQFHGLFCRLNAEASSRDAILAALRGGDFVGVHGELELAPDGTMAPEVRAQLRRALRRSRLLQRVAGRAARLGKMVPAPLKAQLRRIF